MMYRATAVLVVLSLIAAGLNYFPPNEQRGGLRRKLIGGDFVSTQPTEMIMEASSSTRHRISNSGSLSSIGTTNNVGSSQSASIESSQSASGGSSAFQPSGRSDNGNDASSVTGSTIKSQLKSGDTDGTRSLSSTKQRSSGTIQSVGTTSLPTRSSSGKFSNSVTSSRSSTGLESSTSSTTSNMVKVGSTTDATLSQIENDSSSSNKLKSTSQVALSASRGSGTSSRGEGVRRTESLNTMNDSSNPDSKADGTHTLSDIVESSMIQPKGFSSTSSQQVDGESDTFTGVKGSTSGTSKPSNRGGMSSALQNTEESGISDVDKANEANTSDLSTTRTVGIVKARISPPFDDSSNIADDQESSQNESLSSSTASTSDSESTVESYKSNKVNLVSSNMNSKVNLGTSQEEMVSSSKPTFGEKSSTGKMSLPSSNDTPELSETDLQEKDAAFSKKKVYSEKSQPINDADSDEPQSLNKIMGGSGSSSSTTSVSSSVKSTSSFKASTGSGFGTELSTGASANDSTFGGDTATLTSSFGTKLEAASCHPQVLQEKSVTPAFLASYPGSGAKLTWQLIEAITGLFTSDDIDSSGRIGKGVAVAVKTHYPSQQAPPTIMENTSLRAIQKTILLIRNPMNAFPALHRFIYFSDEANAKKSADERPPTKAWIKWRNDSMMSQVEQWDKHTRFWLETFRMENLHLLPFEYLKSPERGSEELQKMGTFLGRDDEIIASSLVGPDTFCCLWEKMIRHDDDQTTHGSALDRTISQGIDEEERVMMGENLQTKHNEQPNPYTKEQLELMLQSLIKIRDDYASYPAFSHLMNEYIEQMVLAKKRIDELMGDLPSTGRTNGLTKSTTGISTTGLSGISGVKMNSDTKSSNSVIFYSDRLSSSGSSSNTMKSGSVRTAMTSEAGSSKGIDDIGVLKDSDSFSENTSTNGMSSSSVSSNIGGTSGSGFVRSKPSTADRTMAQDSGQSDTSIRESSGSSYKSSDENVISSSSTAAGGTSTEEVMPTLEDRVTSTASSLSSSSSTGRSTGIKETKSGNGISRSSDSTSKSSNGYARPSASTSHGEGSLSTGGVEPTAQDSAMSSRSSSTNAIDTSPLMTQE